MALKGVKAPKVKMSARLFGRPTASASTGDVMPVQSLNVIEEKLRREYNLAGPIGATLGKQLQPVIIAGDLRDPGHSPNKGRWWSVAASEMGFGANGVFNWVFGADVLVEGIWFHSVIADGIQVYIVAPDEAVPIAATTNWGTWIDRKLFANDIPPITGPVTQGARTGVDVSNSNRVWTERTGNAANAPIIPIRMMIPSGGALAFRVAAGHAQTNFGMFGRIWP